MKVQVGIRAFPAVQGGALMIEVLITILICAFGLLGFFAVQGRATSSQFESYQRSEALILVSDMVSRIDSNRANAAAYVNAGLIGAGAVADCTGTTGAARDLCEWGNLLRGSTETRGGSTVGAMLSARGCVTQPAGSSDRYIVSVAWQGMVATGASGSTCGSGTATFPEETLRRTVSSSICVGLLRDAAAAPLLPRC